VTVLNVHVCVARRRVVECAAELQTRLPADQWRTLAELAAEIVARWESANSGTRVLLIPAGQLSEHLDSALAAGKLP